MKVKDIKDTADYYTIRFLKAKEIHSGVYLREGKMFPNLRHSLVESVALCYEWGTENGARISEIGVRMFFIEIYYVAISTRFTVQTDG